MGLSPQDAAVAAAPAATSPFGRMMQQFNWQQLVVVGVLLLVILVFNYLSNGIFLSQRNISLLLRQSALLAIVSAGMVMLMVGRQIDLSVGSAVYLAGAVAAMLEVRYGQGWITALVAAIAAGLVLGAFQGIVVAGLKIPAFVATLAGMLIFRGIGYVWTNAATVGPVSNSFKQLNDGFVPIDISLILIAAVAVLGAAFLVYEHRRMGQWAGSQRGLIVKIVALLAIAIAFALVISGFRGINVSVFITILVVAVLTFVMTRTKFGRNLYVIGGNPDAARLAGISIGRQVFIGFFVMGLVYGIGGALITSRLGSSAPTTGNFLELDAISAAVIGGTSLVGGIGTVPGALIGALLLSSIDNGMSLTNVSSFLQLVVKGFILLAAVWFDLTFRKR